VIAIFHHGWGAWFAFAALLRLVFFGAIIGLIVALFRRDRPHYQAPVPPPPSAPMTSRSSAEQILAERLARGEIDPDDYAARLQALREHAPQ
jgi:putative membrane protein